MPPAGDQPRPTERTITSVTCLGCGCACDDIRVVVRGGRITEAQHACELGTAWFGDGTVPTRTQIDGRDAASREAIDAIAARLAAAHAPLIYLAPELSCEAQREAIALADAARATIDTVSTATVLGSIVASQERGRAAATLGEVRNRADVIVCWGVDPNERYPRYWSRYGADPIGLYVDGRRGRRVVAVDIGDRRGPADADVRVVVPADEEVATLTAVDAILRQPSTPISGPLWTRARELAEQLTTGRYVVIVADAEPPLSSSSSPRPQLARATALIALSQALNGPTRAALSMLRGGGNRSGAETVLTAQTGYPTGVSFRLGYPEYRPFDTHAADTVLIVGDPTQVPAAVSQGWSGATVAVIGPRASQQATASIAIDTGVAGIHCPGIAVRMDDVPLALRAVLEGPGDPEMILKELRTRSLRGAR